MGIILIDYLGKDEQIYQEMFRAVKMTIELYKSKDAKRENRKIACKKIVIDFEKAMWNVIKSLDWLIIEIIGCYFHLAKNIR